jgi:hypothetical protein
MSQPDHRDATPLPATEDSFSLMMGGPLYQLWRRTRLSGDALELLHRRMVLLLALSWLPLLALTMLDGRAWGDAVQVTFVRDLEMHARLLLALPLLLAAELVVHRWTRAGMAQFIAQSMVCPHDSARFQSAIGSAMRLRNSITMEVTLLVLVYAIGIGYLWNVHLKLEADSWYGHTSNGVFSLSAAGWWAVLVSLPLFQFILVRWFYRILIWGRLLFQVSRLDLDYMPAHPDRCGGLGFLSTISQGFAPILLATSTLLSGVIADRVLYQGDSLPEFTMEIVGIVLLMLVSILGPLLFFTPGMIRAKLQGHAQFGALASRYVRAFSGKWVAPGRLPEEPLLGHADFQSLADISSSFELVERMRWAPLSLVSVLQLVGISLLPLAPLLLTMFPMAELAKRVLGVLF